MSDDWGGERQDIYFKEKKMGGKKKKVRICFQQFKNIRSIALGTLILYETETSKAGKKNSSNEEA